MGPAFARGIWRDHSSGNGSEKRLPNWKKPTPYGREAIQYNASGIATSLRVELSGETLDLARIDVGPPDEPDKKDTIFYLNISPDPATEFFTPGAYEAAVTWYEDQILSQGIRVLVIPPSHKSTEALHEAVTRANSKSDYEIKIIDLVGGKNEPDVSGADPDFKEFYTPITTPGGKYIGMKTEDAQYLVGLLEKSIDTGEPLIIWIGDDVVSSGETLQAMRKLILRATHGRAHLKTLAVALEADKFPEEEDSDTVAAMRIIEIKGGIKDGFVNATT